MHTAMSQSPPKFYLTTPIYYVNARPHIGHAYTTIVADVIARRSRAQGVDTWFLTGTDEHGQKIERSALAAGVPPQQFTDQVSETFREPWRRMGITNDDFIRTTEPRHKQGVQKLFLAIKEAGYIDLQTYTGAYCVSDETFVDVEPGSPCPECGNITEVLSESNFYFKLSAFQDKVLALIESNELLIEPDTLRNEVLSFVRGGLKDLSISRTSIKWGIPVPGHPDHVIYVWLDALANYMTAVGYGSDAPEDLEKFNRYWPADLHLIGKEIARFHCIYWPAFLLAAGEKLPKKIAANGWLLFHDSKMSKSKGNVVRIETILDAFGTLCPATPLLSPSPQVSSFAKGGGPASSLLSSRSEAKGSAVAFGISVGLQPHELATENEGALAPAPPTKAQQDLFASDVLRYFLLREVPYGQDGNFSLEAMVTRYNADLVNGYGNLVSRTLTLASTQFHSDTVCPAEPWACQEFEANPEDEKTSVVEMQSGTASVIAEICNLANVDFDFYMRQTEFHLALTEIYSRISVVDGYLSWHKPWKLAKSTDGPDRKKLIEILYTAAESIRIITALLYPILPYATASVWRQLGLGDIEEAARTGQLKDLQWGGLKPGTRLGPLAPIFPRADKGLTAIMMQMEQDQNTPISHANAAHDAATSTLSEFPEMSLASATVPHEQSVVPSVESVVSTSPSDASPQITIDDFAKIELRVAQILVAERIPKADKLLRLEVDLGYEKRQILSGIAEWYTPEELVGRRIVVITNLAPRKMRGLESHGMLLAASTEGGKPHLATFADSAQLPLGSRLK